MTDGAELARFERKLGRLLTAGVLVSACTLTLGLLLFLVSPESGAGARLLSTGLFILMATPVLRVVISVVEYVRIQDWAFVIITLVVLIQLAITFFLALR